MKREYSAGAVVFREERHHRTYLILHHPDAKNSKGMCTPGHWDFPKGHVEDGETARVTAAREVAEETGLDDLRFYDGFEKKIHFSYLYRFAVGERRHKSVIFFLAETHTKKIILSAEHQHFGWYPYDGALKRLTYANGRMVIRGAEMFLRRVDAKAKKDSRAIHPRGGKNPRTNASLRRRSLPKRRGQ
ncbi:MAG: NUDIX domain-containing protein [bacterium]|nr:NUDIX domain-containing protein [bacterium]MDZ4299619.1 NUDIX domain-containing protein [Candidatus Sungbacteria bacterium]